MDNVSKLKEQLHVLRDIQKIYPMSSIDNVIQQIESRVKFYEKEKKEK